MAEIKKIIVDETKIKLAIQNGIPLTITTYTLPHEMEQYIGDVLKSFLLQLNQRQMIETLSYCIKELVNNAKKANTKRVYFIDKGLDINNRADYGIGMKTFKKDTLNNINYYLDQQRKLGLYIKVSFQTRNNKIKIDIRNKAALTVFEYKRIHDKITRAQMYKSVAEGMSQLLDDSEGAGLGLVIMILVLKNIGLTEENFQVTSENGETMTRLILPFNEKLKTEITSLSKSFVNLIDGLPEFPENISRINQLISDPKSKMSDIASSISNDVALTAELLKLVNSAAYMLSSPCNSIAEAVKIVGLRGIRNLLYSIGSMHNLMLKANSENKKMWDHSYQVAFNAYNLARNFCTNSKDRACIDDSYVCGLLHDMGKIIFENAHPAIMNQINEICASRGISMELFESLIAGVNHGEVGALIAEKWNFSEDIINVIRYHHDPESAPEQYKKLTCVVYLADSLSYFAEKKITYDQIEPFVLKTLGINSEEQLNIINERLTKTFKNPKAR